MIRRAENRDVKRITEIIFNEYIEVNGPATGINFNFRNLSNNIAGIIGNEQAGIVLVYEINDKIVGIYLGLYSTQITDGDTPMLNEICWYVDTEYRGNGLGRELVRVANEKSVEIGIKSSVVAVPFTASNLPEVVKKYISTGWMPVQVTFSKQIGV